MSAVVYVSSGVCQQWCLSAVVFVSSGVCQQWCLSAVVFVSSGGTGVPPVCVFIFYVKARFVESVERFHGRDARATRGKKSEMAAPPEVLRKERPRSHSFC